MEGDFRTLLRKFCLESSILGLKHFYLYPDIVSRCFWSVNMLAVLSLACLLSCLLYIRFAEMPTRVTIENQYELAQDLPFPSITICSPNQITSSFLRHFNRTLVDGAVTVDLEKALPKLLGFYEYVSGNMTENLAQLQSLLDLNRYTVPEIMAAVGQQCSDFLKLCYFAGVRYPNCWPIFQPLLTTHGLCCTFNNIYHYHDKRNVLDNNFVVKKVPGGGAMHGLVVVTDYNPEDAVDGTILDAGASKVLYTDHTEFPTDDESCLIEPAVETYNAIQATHTYCSDDVKALPTWSRNCYLEDEHRLPYFNRYHNSDCDLVCFALAVQRGCNCTIFYMPGPKPVEKICNLTKIPCIMAVKLRRNEWLTAAQCACPGDCESRRYRFDMSTGNLDAMPYMIVNPFEGIKFNDSTTIMSFYFQSFVYVKQKQETVMSIITLISNLGGVYGLCLGCSGISVLEIFFYVFVAIRNHIKRRIRQRSEIDVEYDK